VGFFVIMVVAEGSAESILKFSGLNLQNSHYKLLVTPAQIPLPQSHQPFCRPMSLR